MKISFKGHSTKHLKLEFVGSGEDAEGIKKFEYGPGLPEQGKDYSIIFKMLIATDCGHEIDVEFHAFFETEQELTEDEKTSKFVLINSPAIAYPYLRAYISNVCLLSGYSPVILPTLNFQQMYNDKQK